MLKALIALIVVAVLALVSNPGPEAHREKLKSEIAARSQLAALFHLGSVAAFVSDYHSVGVASYTTINGQKVSYGAFGWVHVPNLSTGTSNK